MIRIAVKAANINSVARFISFFAVLVWVTTQPSYALYESAGFSVNGGVLIGNHLTVESRYLFSYKNNLHRGGWGAGLLYRF